MNDNEPLAQLLEETRQTNRLLCRQLTWSRILAVVLAIIAAAAVVLAVTFWSTGLFRDISTIRTRDPEPPASQSQQVEMPAAARVNAFFRTASYHLNQGFADLFHQ